MTKTQVTADHTNCFLECRRVFQSLTNFSGLGSKKATLFGLKLRKLRQGKPCKIKLLFLGADAFTNFNFWVWYI